MHVRRRALPLATAAVCGLALTGACLAWKGQQSGFTDTPFLPGSKWRVHDANRPIPPVVTPGALPSTDPVPAPSDAIVLFDGKDLSNWKSGEGPAKWTVKDGYFEVAPGTGPLFTKDSYGDCQIHLEFSSPLPVQSADQGRGNSGLFFGGDRYEVQVLDTYQNRTYADGHAGAVYGQSPPMVNASRAPGEWQQYDVVYRAPRFDSEGKVVKEGSFTVFHNGVLVQDHHVLIGSTLYRSVPKFFPHPPEMPLSLQDHGNKVRFRNIWLRPLPPKVSE